MVTLLPKPFTQECDNSLLFCKGTITTSKHSFNNIFIMPVCKAASSLTSKLHHCGFWCYSTFGGVNFIFDSGTGAFKKSSSVRTLYNKAVNCNCSLFSFSGFKIL